MSPCFWVAFFIYFLQWPGIMIRLTYQDLKKDDGMSSSEKEIFQENRDRLHLEMMSAVSHDLKTPLASIIGSLEIHEKMKAALSEDKKETLLKTALEEAYRLDGFISNILDMARLENNMVTVNKRIYEVDQIIQDCLLKIGNLNDKAEVTVIKPEISMECETDATLLSRAVQCILDNALKHTGNIKPKIQIDYTREDHMLVIHIKDNGTGIPDGDHELIFSKYTRLAKKDYKNAGTGLGLTIARAIIKLLGGWIHLEKRDEEGDYRGARFIIKLPGIVT